MLAMHDMNSLLCVTFLIFMTVECLVIALFKVMYEKLFCEKVIKINSLCYYFLYRHVVTIRNITS